MSGSRPHLCPLLPGAEQWAWVRAEDLCQVPTLVFLSGCLRRSEATSRLMEGVWKSFRHVCCGFRHGGGTCHLSLPCDSWPLLWEPGLASLHPLISSFEQEDSWGVGGWGGLNLEAWALQPPFCHGSQSTYPQDGEALGGWVTSGAIWPPRPLPKVAPLPHSDIGITWLPTPCSLRTSLFSLLPLGEPP